MLTAFLLRFEEFCVTGTVAGVRAGTGTSTRQREQPDADPRLGGHAAIPRPAGLCGSISSNDYNPASGANEAWPDVNRRLVRATRS